MKKNKKDKEKINEYVYKKLKEAEDEMNNNPKFYTIEEIKESIDKTIDKKAIMK